MATALRRGSVAYSRVAMAMFLVGLVTFSLLYWPQALLPQIAREWSLTPAQASGILAMTTLAMALMLIPASLLSDHYGRKPLMQIAMFAGAGLTLAMPWANSLATLWLLRLLTGLVLAFLPALAMTYLNEEIDRRDMAHAFGLYISGTAFGGMSGRLLAVLSAQWGGSAAAALVIGGCAALAALAFSYYLPASQQFQARPTPWSRLGRAGWLSASRRLLSDSVLWVWWGTGFLWLGSFVGLYSILGFRLERAPFHWSALAIGSVFLLYVFGGVASTWSAAFTQRWGQVASLQGLWLLSLLGVLLTLSDAVPVLLLGIALFTLAFFAGHAVASGAVGHRASGHEALASSIYLCCYYAGASVLTPLLGWSWQHAQWPAVVAVLMLVHALGVALSTRLGAGGLLHYAYAASQKNRL